MSCSPPAGRRFALSIANLALERLHLKAEPLSEEEQAQLIRLNSRIDDPRRRILFPIAPPVDDDCFLS